MINKKRDCLSIKTRFYPMYGLERKKLKTLKNKIREKASILYMVDHREDSREIYEFTDRPQSKKP